MRYLLFVSLLLFQFTALGQERYFYFTEIEDSESGYEKALNTNNYIDVDIQKGELTGRFNKQSFQAFYDVMSTSSGFVKGFNYRLALGYLQRDVVADKDFNSFTKALAEAKSFYFYPDFLASPSWHFLEIGGKLKFVRKQ